LDPDFVRLFDLSGRTALVTGVSSGLGVGFSRGLAGAASSDRKYFACTVAL
jgi:NAD(P)-dependent dehydrogenase (short-subunit alcohol dehydrogenase family)